MTVTIRSTSTPAEIEKALVKFEKGLNKTPETKRTFDAFKHCGVITLAQDPIVLQKAARNEWE